MIKSSQHAINKIACDPKYSIKYDVTPILYNNGLLYKTYPNSSLTTEDSNKSFPKSWDK